MSKYYKAEDVTELINACEWRMTLAKERHGEGFVDYSKQILDVDELTKRLSNLPTIEVEEDCISKEPNGVWKAKSFHECFCDNCGFIFDIMKCDFLENMKFCPNCGAKMKGADDE